MMKKIGLILIVTLIFGIVSTASALTVSPKFSYVGFLGVGCEFSPLHQISKDIDLMGEVNWEFWGWNGGAGFVYGELNAVYNLEPVKTQEASGGLTLNPYVGGGLIYGLPMGTALGSGNFSGGLGFGLFGGVTAKFNPYTWFAQLKYATVPITLNYPAPLPSITTNALGLGFETGIRLGM